MSVHPPCWNWNFILCLFFILITPSRCPLRLIQCKAIFPGKFFYIQTGVPLANYWQNKPEKSIQNCRCKSAFLQGRAHAPLRSQAAQGSQSGLHPICNRRRGQGGLHSVAQGWSITWKLHRKIKAFEEPVMKENLEKVKLLSPDLRDGKNFPRSPRETLGGYVLAARAVEECRALCLRCGGRIPLQYRLDQRWLNFAGIDYILQIFRRHRRNRPRNRRLDWGESLKRSRAEIIA